MNELCSTYIFTFSPPISVNLIQITKDCVEERVLHISTTQIIKTTATNLRLKSNLSLFLMKALADEPKMVSYKVTMIYQ